MSLGNAIVKKLDEATLRRAEKGRKEHQQKNWNCASQAGWVHDCMMRLILLRLVPEKEALPDKDQMYRFDEGYKQERLLAKELIDEGYKLTKGKRLYNEELKLTGEVEYLIEINGDTPPIDFKSCSSYMFKQISRCQDAQDLLQSNFIWVRHYPVQMSLYDFLYEQPLGILLFKDKEIGLKHTVDIPYDDSTQQICEGLQMVNEAVRKGKIPKPEYKDACKYCGFFDYCFPESDFIKAKVTRITEAEAIVKARRFCEIEVAGKEFIKLKDELKGQFKGQDVIIEDLLISSTTYEATVYFVPKEIKEEYKGKQERTRTTLKNTIKAF